jgi:hypothetical protein
VIATEFAPDDVVRIIGVIGLTIGWCTLIVTVGIVRYKRGARAEARLNRLEGDLSNLGYAVSAAKSRADRADKQAQALKDKYEPKILIPADDDGTGEWIP